MFDPAKHTTTDFAVALLIHYNFDLGGYTASELIDRWLQDYPANWVCQGVIEALYQGRYKAISVEQILAFWKRRGQALYHYNHEFERLVCGKFPQTLTGHASTQGNASPPVPAAAGFSNEDDDPVVVTVESGTGKKTPVQLVDPTTNVLPVTNQIGEEPTQQKSRQASENNQIERSPRNKNHSWIKQFTPADDGSDFYTKLKTIAQHNERSQESGVRSEHSGS